MVRTKEDYQIERNIKRKSEKRKAEEKEKIRRRKKRKEKNDHKKSKNIASTFSGVVGSVGSVHFQIVP